MSNSVGMIFDVTSAGIRAVNIKPAGKREVVVNLKNVHPKTMDEGVLHQAAGGAEGPPAAARHPAPLHRCRGGAGGGPAGGGVLWSSQLTIPYSTSPQDPV